MAEASAEATGSPLLPRPPRRPLRRCGSSPAIASSSASTEAAPARTDASSTHSSGLRLRARSESRSRSSGVRARRAIRWRSSAKRRRSLAASVAPTTRPSSDWSSMTTGSADGAFRPASIFRAAGPDAARGPGRFGLWRGSARVSIRSLRRAGQSNVKSGWVCSSASTTSSSSGRRPTSRFEGERNRYKTRLCCPPCGAR
jgi:hypothetical protein